MSFPSVEWYKERWVEVCDEWVDPWLKGNDKWTDPEGEEGKPRDETATSANQFKLSAIHLMFMKLSTKFTLTIINVFFNQIYNVLN